jgi:predicted Fe-S protein YdhL (DUF1289 family)
VQSPCVQICQIKDNVCVGCRRTLEEIAQWSRYTDLERQQIIERVSRL